MSYNIWSDQPRNRRWGRRRDSIAAMIDRHHPDSAGLQEANAHMVEDLAARLPQLSWVGVGRDDGKSKGEFNPIFYRKDQLAIMEHDTFWLAPDWTTPGRGWDAFCRRIVTWARFRDRADGSELFHFNTHFDHLGRRARRESARLLLQRISAIASHAPLIVTGDFNCRERSRTYQMLTHRDADKDASSPLQDSFFETAEPPQGPRKTWRGIRPGGLGSARIDYIFVQNGCRVVRYGVSSDRPDSGYPSDHFPVVVDLEVSTVTA